MPVPKKIKKFYRSSLWAQMLLPVLSYSFLFSLLVTLWRIRIGETPATELGQVARQMASASEQLPWPEALSTFLSEFLKLLLGAAFVLLIYRSRVNRHLRALLVHLENIDVFAPARVFKLDRNKTPLPGSEDDLDGLVRVVNDLTGKLQFTYQQLARFNAELEGKVAERTIEVVNSQRIISEQEQALLKSAKLSALGEMAAGIAHEINNPLSVISVVGQQMEALIEAKQDVPSDFLAKKAVSLMKAVGRISKIVQGLRTISRDWSNESPTPFQVKNMVEETMSYCTTRFRNKGVDLVIEPIDPGLSILGREAEVSQVLLNLLNNAFDAVSHLPQKWVSLSCYENHGQVEIRVTDSGSGLSPEVLDKLFQPFFTTKPIGHGTGLGLSISLGIVKNHRGTLVVDTKSPNTSFVVSLPLAAAAALKNAS